MCSTTFVPRIVACVTILLSLTYGAFAQTHAISEAWKTSSQSTATNKPASASLTAQAETVTVPRPVEPSVLPANPPLVLEAEVTETSAAKLAVKLDEELVGIEPPATFNATAYSLPGKTRTGARVRRGVIAADPRVLPLGSVVHLKAGNYSGLYTVHDIGGSVKGRHIDVWMPSSREARSFGRQNVRLTVMKYGGGKKPKAK
ncbi:MAG: 3D domain-containing protein [Blastocatellia bacterium]